MLTSIATLKAELENRIAADERQLADDPAHFQGRDWWQLSDAEMEVFGLEMHGWPRLMWTWHCFEIFAGMSDAIEFTDSVMARVRIECRHFLPPTEEEDPRQFFLGFAKEFGDLTNRDAFAVQRKQEAWELRARVLAFADGSE